MRSSFGVTVPPAITTSITTPSSVAGVSLSPPQPDARATTTAGTTTTPANRLIT